VSPKTLEAIRQALAREGREMTPQQIEEWIANDPEEAKAVLCKAMVQPDNPPPGWTAKDPRDLVPPEAMNTVVTFCEHILKERHPKHIARRGKEAFDAHKTAFANRGVDIGFFAYWLENAYNTGQLPAFVQCLKQPKPPPQKRLSDILPPACIEKLKAFVQDVRGKCLIIEPGKAVVTMLRERVLDPHRDEIIKPGTGAYDLDYLSIVLCTQLGIDPN